MDDFVHVDFTNFDKLIYNRDINNNLDDKNYSLIQNNLEFKIETFIKNINQIDFIVNYQDIYNFCNYSKEDLIRQYKIDSVRQDVYYNNFKINEPNILLDYLTYSYPEYIENILMFITQTIYAFIIKDIHLSLPENTFVGEISGKKQRMRIDININNEFIQIKSKKKLQIFSVKSGDSNTIFEFDINFDIDLINSKLILVQLTR